MQEPRDESWPPALNAVEEIGFVVSLRGLDEGEIEQRVFDERRRRLERPDYPEGYFDRPKFVLSLEQPVRLPSLPRDLVALACQLQPYSPRKNRHDFEQQSENTLSEHDREDHSQLEFQALERLFPLFLRLLLEGRFSRLFREHFGHAPDVISKASFHGGGTADAGMDSAEIVPSHV